MRGNIGGNRRTDWAASGRNARLEWAIVCHYLMIMTANQLMIPLAIALLVVLIVSVKLRNRYVDRASLQRDHRPNIPPDGRDDGAVARSIGQGHGAGGGPN